MLTSNASDTLQERYYKYSGTGDIVEINDADRRNVYTYTYDKLHRLIAETNSGGAGSGPSGVLDYTHDDVEIAA